MTLGRLIETLRNTDPQRKVAAGFGYAHSYRGSYADVAFEPEKDTTVGKMLFEAELALDTTYPGYKGGNFTMHKNVDCYLAYEGDTGEEIGPTLLQYMLGEVR